MFLLMRQDIFDLLSAQSFFSSRPALQYLVLDEHTTEFQIENLSGPSCLLVKDSLKEQFEFLQVHSSVEMFFKISEDNIVTDILRLDLWMQNKQGVDQTGTSLLTGDLISSDRAELLINQIADTINTSLVFDGFVDIVRIISSELLTNAFYNAPFSGVSLVGIDRTSLVQLQSARRVEVGFSETDAFYHLKVTDKFGSFSREKLLKNLIRCSETDKVTVRTHGFGAGIGLFMVFGWASRLSYLVVPGQETTVSVSLLKTRRLKAFDSESIILEIVEKNKNIPLKKKVA